MALEEQAYPFEEKGDLRFIESNLELMALGIYNEWIEKSLEKAGPFHVPARYDKKEVESPCHDVPRIASASA